MKTTFAGNEKDTYNSNMVKTYTLYTTQENEFKLVSIIQEAKIHGTFWPNSTPVKFILNMSEEDLLMLKLRVPFTMEEPCEEPM